MEIGKFASEDEINPDLLVTPIDANVVIIDEASMIDLFLMNYLMKALYNGYKINISKETKINFHLLDQVMY